MVIEDGHIVSVSAVSRVKVSSHTPHHHANLTPCARAVKLAQEARCVTRQNTLLCAAVELGNRLLPVGGVERVDEDGDGMRDEDALQETEEERLEPHDTLRPSKTETSIKVAHENQCDRHVLVVRCSAHFLLPGCDTHVEREDFTRLVLRAKLSRNPALRTKAKSAPT